MEEASGEGTMEEASWRRHKEASRKSLGKFWEVSEGALGDHSKVCEVSLEDASWRGDHGGGIMDEESTVGFPPKPKQRET